MKKKTLKAALLEEKPLKIVGVVNAYLAALAGEAGFLAIYLSGASVANFCYRLPDIGVTSFDQVFEEAFRITSSVETPLLVDMDTGWGSTLSITRAIKAFEKIGVSSVHIEDQADLKRCGHLPGKLLVSIEEMEERLQAASSARSKEGLSIMARCDALEKEGIQGAIERSLRYLKAGADMIFLEGVHNLDEVTLFKKRVHAPLLINVTEFGKTPLFSEDELKEAQVEMVLFPLTLARGMNFVAKQMLKDIHEKGTQKKWIEKMETREELYHHLNYCPEL